MQSDNKLHKVISRLNTLTLCYLAITLTATTISQNPATADEVSAIVDLVNQESYTNYHYNELYTHDGNERRYGPNHDMARDFIRDEMTRLGLAVEMHAFTYSGTTYYNVVGVHEGTVNPEQIYIVGAHYDSVSCPGADDNASGTAGVIEAARILSQFDFESTLIFIAFDREEQGLYGSNAYASDHRNDNILGMISLDMISYNPNNHNSAMIYGTSASNPIKQALNNAINLYSNGITASIEGGLDASDHAPFEWYGFDACLLIEADVWSNPYYHTTADSVDTPNYIDYEYATKMLRATVGYLAESAVLKDIVLSDPVPGIAGQNNLISVNGATPGQNTFLVYGFNDGSTGVPPCPGINVNIAKPKIAASQAADANGTVDFNRFIPPAASGMTILIQAVEPATCEVSNLTRFTFQ